MRTLNLGIQSTRKSKFVAILLVALMPVAEAACRCVCQGDRGFPLCEHPSEIAPFCGSKRCPEVTEEVGGPSGIPRQKFTESKEQQERSWERVNKDFFDRVKERSADPFSGANCTTQNVFDPKTNKMIQRQYCQ